QLFKMLTAENGRHLLMQALLAAPMFQVRWRWNVTRALAVLRRQAGKKVPPHLQRFRADDLLAAAFPETVGCLENHHGDVEIPDHPYVRQTMHDCLHEAMDVDRWINLLESIENKQTELVPRDTREPSPFAHQLLNANPYAFLDGAPLEERRTRAVATRRSLSTDDFDDLTRLDEDAIRQVRQEAWPLVRDADELHDALHSMVVARDDELNEWRQWLVELQREGRAARIELDPPADDAAVDGERPETTVAWIASERWPLVSAVYKNRCRIEREPRLPESLQRSWDASAGWVEILRGRTQVSGPASESALAELVLLKPAHVHSSLEALEGQGVVLRGRFTDECRANETTEWCDRRLLARIHRMTLDGLRRRIQPVTPEQFMRFLVDHHHLRQDAQWRFAAGAREAIGQLQGFEAPAAAWENELLAARVENYEPQWLDQLFLGGEAVWGRLRPPQRDESRSNAAPMTRVMPMCLALREHLSWLLPPQREPTTTKLSGSAEDVLNALSEHGALFAQDLKAVTELLPGHLDEALRELTSYGRITSDGFAAIRALLVANHRTGRHRRRHETVSTMSAPAGRWSLFPGPTAPIEHDEYLRKWCRLLLRRYGVVFRDLLGRESTAPPWRELVPQFRRLELRGEIRGGRFISGVSGEQFAEEAAVERLREVRDRDPENEWIVLSAADPLNLFGVITPGGRLPALYKNRFLLINGELAATLQSGKLELFIDADPATTWEIHQALLQGRRREASIVGVPPG
ncbi:MAG: DEAD/DEAH box helicase, partial [Pirellulaceae bacterium]|nr:DEAD/DEAH box helicase [Pirellulaceae bacterium]